MKVNSKIKVLIVEDSAIMRKVLSEQLKKSRMIEIVGTAPTAHIASYKLLNLQPDVITLDLQLPELDGLQYLKKLMKHYPLPVLIISSYTPRGGKKALEALELGAVDVMEKPNENYSLEELGKDLIEKVKIASSIQFPPTQLQKEHKSFLAKENQSLNPNSEYMLKLIELLTSKKSLRTEASTDLLLRRSLNNRIPSTALKALPKITAHYTKVIAIGASIGGTQALRTILERLPTNTPPILIVQHMPPKFTRSFAEHLNLHCDLTIKEAEHGEILNPGTAYIAPGGYHMLVNQEKVVHYQIELDQTIATTFHRPSVEVLFQSVAKEVGSKAIGIILTGMGSDGSEGLLAMKKSGAKTIAQNRESCVVFGMPREAIARGAVEYILSIEKIPEMLSHLLQLDNEGKV